MEVTPMSMRNKKWLIVLGIVLLVAFWLWYTGRLDVKTAPHQADAVSYAAGVSGAAPDQLLVDFRNDATDDQVAAVEKKYGLRLRPNSRFSLVERLYRAAVRWRDASGLLDRLRAEPAIERAELDAVYGIPPLESEATRFSAADQGQAKFPDDPKYRFQWHLDQIGMPAAWARASGKGVIVAVIDTGVAYRDRGDFKQVPDLAKTAFVDGYDFINKNEHALDDHGHGTHVAGTIAQSTNNGVGVAGIAYRARIMPLKVLSARGYGSVADIAEAVRFAADHGAKVINMSLGGPRASRILENAVKYAHGRGVTVVCAAGNDGRGRVGYPAAYAGAIAVAATQFDRTTTFYSNWGKEIDVAAPGGNTRVDQNGDGMPDGVLQNTIMPGHPDQNDYLLFMGTSMASPHVAGVAALVIEGGVTKPDAVERVLKATAKHPGGAKRDDHYGAGIVDAGAAVRRASTEEGGYALALSALLGLVALLRLRERGQLALRAGLGLPLGLLVGAGGLFFLPSLGLVGTSVPAPVWGMVTHGVPSWDMALFGAATPLLHSLLAPLLLAALLYGVTRARGLLVGFALGVAGHLLYGALSLPADIVWIPDLLDRAFLALNGLGCLAIAHVLAKK
jgi:serine protease